jgi:hypothetical protein
MDERVKKRAAIESTSIFFLQGLWLAVGISKAQHVVYFIRLPFDGRNRASSYCPLAQFYGDEGLDLC